MTTATATSAAETNPFRDKPPTAHKRGPVNELSTRPSDMIAELSAAQASQETIMGYIMQDSKGEIGA